MQWWWWSRLLYLKLWNPSRVSEKSAYYPAECLWPIYSASHKTGPRSATLVTAKVTGLLCMYPAELFTYLWAERELDHHPPSRGSVLS